ncbi:L-lactate MFS transporter [Natrinema salifodinae]|uniref:MFS transporter, OFA family, oxalate/formate antiporter n=1 Tax=Natrinema salifodinae TaxID=1202768 RepID=A0A1I0MJA9_9EURY|nr:OFA family MFS transporter [Natrinema salifodinae]SEV87910.1 MFS transporter, OFA family, oxalate/formate antiporter [Natrinema salifodinae]
MVRTDADRNRWLIALSAVAIHLSIGSIYAYSVYQNPLRDELGWAISDVSLAFTVAIVFLALSAAFLGGFVERHGPRISGLLAAATFGLGIVGAGVSVQLGSYVGFLLTFGVISGIGIGLGYISPISTLVQWFPDRRGMATGLAVMGFGAGALVTGPIANAIIEAASIPVTFYALGVAYFALMAAGASYLQKPPADWVPEGVDESEIDTDAEKGVSVNTDLEELTASEALRTPRYYLVWLVMFINISAGIMLLSVASPMTQVIAEVDAATAASVVGLIGIFNGGGRIFWATVSDYIGRTTTYGTFFGLQIAAFLLMPQITHLWLFAGLLFLIISVYGGGFACLPAYLGDLFGTRELSAIHGYTLTAWGAAGVAGPMLISEIVERTGSYVMSFYVITGALTVGLFAVGLLYYRIEDVRESTHRAEPEAV